MCKKINEFVMILSDFFSNFCKIRHSERFNKKTEQIVTRLKFPDETDLHSRVVWLSLFAHKGVGSNPGPSENLLAKVKIFKKKHAKMDKLARYFPKVGNSEYFSRKKLRQNKIDRFHLKHPVQLVEGKFQYKFSLYPTLKFS